jgi:predicted nucleic acid-binding protein
LTAVGGQHPGAIAQQLDWVEIGVVSNQILVNALQIELDKGEAEAIALAQELAADLLLIDEHLGRAAATRLGLRIIGLLGVLTRPSIED